MANGRKKRVKHGVFVANVRALNTIDKEAVKRKDIAIYQQFLLNTTFLKTSKVTVDFSRKKMLCLN